MNVKNYFDLAVGTAQQHSEIAPEGLAAVIS